MMGLVKLYGETWKGQYHRRTSADNLIRCVQYQSSVSSSEQQFLASQP